MNSLPLISVLMTAYNREKYIAEAIDSVLVQTYAQWELIIVDDGSKDNTVSVAQSYALKDSRIKIFINEKNLGDYPNRNKAASYAAGKYLMYVDSDDTLYPDSIKKCVELMEQFPQSGFGISVPALRLPNSVIFSSEEAIHHHFFKEPFLIVGPGGTIQRKTYFDQIKQYPIKYGPANDMYHHLKAACYSPVVLLPFEFLYYRRHDGQEINNRYSYLYNSYNYLRDAVNELPLPLSRHQKKWVLKKNNRRFIVNIFKYFWKTFSFRKTFFVIKQTSFSFKDFFEGVLHI